MAGYAAFLRGVNVGGINIKMSDLRKMFAELGFGGAKTILASGNVLFDADGEPAELKRAIEAGLRETFGYDAWIVLYDIETLRTVVAAYPFDPEREGWHPYVVLSSDPGVFDELTVLSDDLDPATERIALGDGVLYWEVERGHTLDSTFGKATGKKRFKSTTTTRNLRTLNKVLA
jgi:uncharacterized protein (DUF1697 family)